MKTNLRTRLSTRIHIKDIQEVLHYIHDDQRLMEEIYQLIFDEDDIVSYQALWACTHLSDEEVAWAHPKQDRLIEALLSCPHSGRRRLLLNVLYRQPVNDSPRVDLLDFCMERMMSRQEPPAVQAICMKLAHKLTRSYPELQQELRMLLEIMEPELLCPALRSSRKDVLKALSNRRSQTL